MLSGMIVNKSYGQKAEKQENIKTCKKDHNCDKNGPLGFIPNLTEEQKSKIKELHLNLKKEVILLKNQIGEKEAHLKTITMVDKVDMGEVNKTIDETYALKASLAKKRSAFHQEVRALLNNEQRIIFDSKASCCKKSNHKKMDGKNKGCGEAPKGGKNCNMNGNNNDIPKK